MIYYLSTERYSATVRYFLRDNGAEPRRLLRSWTYEELFFERTAPAGHYIFTDFDRLSRFEIECATAFAMALQRAVPEARILNHPLKALERYPLLLALHRTGINELTATRIECNDRPPSYPVFIRAEDGYGGPETGLLNSEDEYDKALAELTQRGLPRRGRIAVGYAGERMPDGYFHKYGALNIGGRIVPQHLNYGRDWVVKFFGYAGGGGSQDEAFGNSELGVAQELRYVRESPHEAVLKRAFDVGGIEFGRADYAVVNGRVQIYEINTNPYLPFGKIDPRRAEKQKIVVDAVLQAFREIDTALHARRRVRFDLPTPKAHNLHWPRQRLAASLSRRSTGWLRSLFTS